MRSTLLCFAVFLVWAPLKAQDRDSFRDAVPGRWEGRVVLTVEDNFAAGTSRTIVTLETDEGKFEIAPGSVNPAWKTDQWVSVLGRRSGTRIAVDEWSAAAPRTPASGVCTTTGVQNPFSARGTLYLGMSDGHPLTGYIDEPAVWNRALSATELLAHYNAKAVVASCP